MFLARAADTEALGASLADALLAAYGYPQSPGSLPEWALNGLIFLSGELGAGKTTVVRGLVHRFGFEGAVKSPTYTLVEPYGRGALRIYHFDLYRVADPEELEYLGARDYFAEQALCLIEWPERAGNRLPEPDLRVDLDFSDAGRRASISAGSALGGTLVSALADD